MVLSPRGVQTAAGDIGFHHGHVRAGKFDQAVAQKSHRVFEAGEARIERGYETVDVGL